MKREEIPSHVVDLGLKQGATDVAVSLVEQDRTMIRFSNNEVTVSKVFKENLLGIFLMIERQRSAIVMAFSSVKGLDKVVNNLVKTAKNTPPADVYAPLPKGPFQYDHELLKGSKVSFDPDKLTGYVEEAIAGALEGGAVKAAGTLTATKAKMMLATSGSVQATQQRNGLEISVRAFKSDVASGHSVSIAKTEREFRPAETGRMAGEIAKAALNPKPGQPGKYTSLLGPMVFADLVNQVGILSSAFLVDAGQSFLIDKIGSQVASEKFTLVDDPTVKDAYGVRAFDDEGVPTRTNVIVEKGVLKTYLHNSTTAKKFGVETTSNAGLIEPHPWNLIVEAGDKSFEELLAEIDMGVYVTNDWYLRYQNYRTGDFSTIPRDGMFLVKNGEIAASIRELRISDNMLRILQNIIELSKSRAWVKWWEVEVPTLAPFALIKDLNLTKSKM
ncbi:MAG: TldD/PmbA family protein [Candidatus Bathyarchaeia archaeon]